MTTFLKRAVFSPWFILGTTVAVIVATYMIGQHYGLKREEWPGWVQAIGSVAAILVAVWVSWQQMETQRWRDTEKEKDELASLLRALRTEIECSADLANRAIGEPLQRSARGEPYLSTLPILEDPFDIYNALLPRFGAIRDDELRDQIVRTYMIAKGFVLTLRYHNELLGALEQSRVGLEHFKTEAALELVRRRNTALAQYSDSLRDSYAEATVEMAKLRPLLDRY